jgi:hypothetical protein
MLGWKYYGNGYVIFDASASTSPTGSAVNNTNSATAWSATYPTLMGWDGIGTYGVRVDSARVADTATSATYLNSLNYIQRTGSSGNANTDFQNTPVGSTRIQGDDLSLVNGPGNGWWFYQNMRHSNPTSYWGTQVAWGWEDNANRLATRNVAGGIFGDWIYYSNSLNTFGLNQTWQDVTASREQNATYTNSTGRPIQVSISVRNTAVTYGPYLTIGGIIIARSGDSDSGLNVGGAKGQLTGIVPNGITYLVTAFNSAVDNWAELR